MIKKLTIVLIAFLALQSQAQEGTQSPYSFFGLGSLKFRGTVENQSMGGLSIFTDSIHVNLRNPASYAGNNLKVSPFNNEGRVVKFAVAGELSSINLKANGQNEKTGTTTFDYLILNFPLGKFGVGFGLLPYTSVGYKLEDNITLDGEELLKNRYYGDGGLNKVFVGVGYQFTKDLSAGIDINYNFGNVENNSIEFGYDVNGDPLSSHSKEVNRSDLFGLSYNFGISYKPMITQKLQLTSGLTYTPKSKITSENQRAFGTILYNFETEEEFILNTIQADLAAQNLENTTLYLPARLSLGAGIGQPHKWFVGAEYTNLKTSQYSNAIFSTNSNATFEDSSTFAIGGFFIPQYTSFNKYLKRVVYRAGAHYGNTGLKINDESINEFGISFGVGLPVGNMFSNVNLGFEYGQRGTTKQNLVQEDLFKLQISLSLNDRWFVKRKYN